DHQGTACQDRAVDDGARFFIARARTLRPVERRALISPEEELPITRQCELLQVARSSFYYEPVSTSKEDLQVMALIDQIHTDLPFLGSRRIADELRDRGYVVNRKRVQRLMQLMGITAIYPK